MLFIDTGAIEVVTVVVTSIIGMLGVSAGIIGYLVSPMGVIYRILSAFGGVLMIIPGTLTDLIGIVIILAVYLSQKLKENNKELNKLSCK